MSDSVQQIKEMIRRVLKETNSAADARKRIEPQLRQYHRVLRLVSHLLIGFGTPKNELERRVTATVESVTHPNTRIEIVVTEVAARCSQCLASNVEIKNGVLRCMMCHTPSQR